MSKSWGDDDELLIVAAITGDRASLERSEPHDDDEGTCPLCGTRVAHPLEPGGTVLCHPERGGCGAIVRPVPYLAGVDGGPREVVAPDRTPWQSCCHPYIPVGSILVHSRRCELFPNRRLTPTERVGYRAEMRARLRHPAGGTELVGSIPAVRSVDVEGYVDAHLDDDDDRG